jgi:hypothetical protein
MEVLGTGCQRRAIPTAVLRMLSGPRYGGLVEILFEQSRPPILCHHLGAFAHEAEADEQTDIPALGKTFTVDTAFARSAWIQRISFPRVDFFPTMDSLLGPSGFGKRENRDAGEGRRPIASLHKAGWLNVVSKRPGEACDAPAVDRGSDDNRDNQSCCIAGGHRRTSNSTMHLSSPFNARLEAGGSAMGLHLPERSHLQF